jgi:hypothetical protein
MGQGVSFENFNSLSDKQKKDLLVDAKKVSEYQQDLVRYELFTLEDFYVEVKIDFLQRYRIITGAYSLQNIPKRYTGQIAKFN